MPKIKPKPTWGPNAWKPVRRGAIYCSPACGFGCKYAHYVKANERGKALAKKMGKGWTFRVWENGTWYYAVTSPDGRIAVHPPTFKGSGYIAFVDNGIFSAYAKTPRQAVNAVIVEAKKRLASMQALVESL